MYEWIIQEIIKEEKEKEKIENIREDAVLYIEPPELQEEIIKEEKSERGVIIIDIA